MSADAKVKAPLPIDRIPPTYIQLLFHEALPRYAKAPLTNDEVRLPEREAQAVLVAASFLGILRHTDELQMDHDLVRTDLLKALSDVHELDGDDIAQICALIDCFENFRIAQPGHPPGAWITEAWWHRYQVAEYRYPSMFARLVEHALSYRDLLMKVGALAPPPEPGHANGESSGGNVPGFTGEHPEKFKAPIARILPSFVPVLLEHGVSGYAREELPEGETRLPPEEVRGVIIASTLLGVMEQTSELGMPLDLVRAKLLKSLPFVEGIGPNDIERALALVDRFEHFKIIREEHPFGDWISEAWWSTYQVVPYRYPSALSGVVEYALSVRQILSEQAVVSL